MKNAGKDDKHYIYLTELAQWRKNMPYTIIE